MRTRSRHNRCLVALAALLAMMVGSAAVPVCAQDELTMMEGELPGSYALTATLQVDDPSSLDARIIFNRQDDANYYSLRLTASETSLQRVADGKTSDLGICRPPTGLDAGEYVLTVRRADWRIVAILGAEVLARGWDRTLTGGQAGYSAAGGSLADGFVQPLGELFLSDDFVREEDAPSEWEPLQGVWKSQSLRVDEQSERMEADKSMNAFSYLGKSAEGGSALTTAGHWFWSSYSVAAAVRAEGTDVVGLVAYLQDADNYLAARWSSALADGPEADRLSLVQVIGGETTVLAEAPGGHVPDQWYSMRFRLCDGLVQCAIDGETRLVATTEAFGQGQPGLYCEGSDGSLFDSVLVDRWEVMADDFDMPRPGRWVAAGGTWSNDDGRMRASGEGERLCLTGGQGWSRYIYSADFYIGGKGGVGLVACATDDREYVLRFGAGKSQLLLRTEGKSSELASSSAGVKPKGWHRAAVVVEEGLITVYLDGRRLFDAFDGGAMAGRVGLYVDGNSAALFDNAYLALLPARRSTRLTKEFTEGDEHPEMAEWASTRAPWIKPAEDAEPIWWTKGDYYGDKQIKFSIPKVGDATGSARLRIDSEPDAAGHGMTLVIEATKGSKTLKVSLLSGEKTVREAEIEVASDPCPVLVEMRGTYLVTIVDEQVVFSVEL
jgi:hypothetical protein